MNQYDEQKLGVLFERVDNLIATLHSYTVLDRQRHEDNELALKTHIETTLPIINDFFKMRGEFNILQKAMWLMAGALLTTIGMLVVNFFARGMR